MLKFLRSKALLAFLLAFFPVFCWSQSSTVTANIADPSSQVWANGTISYSIYGQGPYKWNGAALPNSYYSATTVYLDAAGHGSFSVPSTSAISPIGSLWKIVACPNSSSNCVTNYLPINGASVDISTAVNTLIPIASIPIQTVPKAYNDAAITTQITQGGLYYNVGSLGGLRYWNGTSFQPIGGGSGGAVSSVANTDSTLTVSPTTGNIVTSLNLAHANTWTGAQTFSDGTNTAALKNGSYGTGLYFVTGTSNVTQYADATGYNVVDSVGQAYMSSTNSFTDGLHFDLNGNQGGNGSPAIYPMNNLKTLSLGNGNAGVSVGNVFIGLGYKLQASTAVPLDFSNNGYGIKLNLTSAPCLGTDGTNTVISVTCGSGGGGTLSPSGTPTVNALTKFTSSTAVGNSAISDNGTTVTSTEPISVSVAGGAGAAFTGAEGTGQTASTGNCNLWADSTNNTWMANCNGGANYALGYTAGAANTTITVGTTAIAANTCTAASTVSLAGVTTTSTLNFTSVGDPTAVTGWGSTGGLTIAPWGTANTVNYKICNQTASSITPSASVTFNVSYQNHGVN